jgi:hypothetical protein
MKDLVMNMEDKYENKECEFSAAMKLLNRSSVDRTISKQEAMCLQAQLPLIFCSERIETVSLSHFKRICSHNEATKDKKVEDTIWITEYRQRTGDSTVSFHHYGTK